MAAGLSISGLVSGLDANSIVTELIRAERIPVTQMERRQSEFRSKVDAWSSITTKLSSVRTSVDALTRPDRWRAFASVSSSNEAAVVATSSGEPATGAVSFTVDRLATRHQTSSASTFASGADTVGAGTFTVTIGGTAHDVVTTASTTVDQVARQINDLDAGVSARVMTVGTGAAKLVLTAKETGAANQFTATGTQAALTTATTLQAGQDAQLTLGDATGTPLVVTRASNSVTDLIPGVTLSLKATSATPVTVDVTRDADAAFAAVKGMVDSVNGALTTLGQHTKAGADVKAGVLSGDGTARRLVDGLRRSMSNAVAGLSGTYSYAGSVGIALQADGTYKVDEAKFREAYAADPQAVENLFTRSARSTDVRAGYVTHTDATKPTDHAVRISRAAQVASITGASYVPPPTDPEVFTITAPDGTEISVSVAVGAGINQAITAINTALASAGFSRLAATETDLGGGASAITLTDDRYGSTNGWTVASVSGSQGAFGLVGSFNGEDVAGTIGGVAATGAGRTLSGATGSDGAGLVLTITATDAEVTGAGGDLDLGTVKVTHGIAGTFDELLDQYEGSDGLLKVAKDSWESRIELYQDRIEAFELRLTSRETTLRRQFSAMESALSGLSSQANWLASQLGNLG